MSVLCTPRSRACSCISSDFWLPRSVARYASGLPRDGAVGFAIVVWAGPHACVCMPWPAWHAKECGKVAFFAGGSVLVEEAVCVMSAAIRTSACFVFARCGRIAGDHTTGPLVVEAACVQVYCIYCICGCGVVRVWQGCPSPPLSPPLYVQCSTTERRTDRPLFCAWFSRSMNFFLHPTQQKGGWAPAAHSLNALGMQTNSACRKVIAA